MKTRYNKVFQELLSKFNLSDNFNYDIKLPNEILEILNDEIILTKNGITLKSFGKLCKATNDWENQSIIEDEQNHFHVDWLADSDSKMAFMLGAKTLILLSLKFSEQNFSNIRFSFSFQTPELSQEFDKLNGLYDENEDRYISDRLSFHSIRETDEIVNFENKNNFEALLILEI